jgi:hypothetical protein
MTDTNYTIGSKANGYILTEQGWQIDTTSAPQVAPAKSNKGLKIAGGIVAGVLALSIIGSIGGGSTEVEASTPTPEPVAEAPVEVEEAVEVEAEPTTTVDSDALSDTEIIFVEFFEGEFMDMDAAGERTLIDTATAVCEGFDAGLSFTDVHGALSTNLPDDVTNGVIAGALFAYCPEHQDVLN